MVLLYARKTFFFLLFLGIFHLFFKNITFIGNYKITLNKPFFQSFDGVFNINRKPLFFLKTSPDLHLLVALKQIQCHRRKGPI